MTDAECPATAPKCTNDTCWDGGEGDPCVDASACMDGQSCSTL